MDLGASSGTDGWSDVLQLLKEQNEKTERLARDLSIIRQGMLRNNPCHVTDSVNEAAEVLGGILNTHKCLLESGVEIQKRIESHLAMKRMGIFRRPRPASLGDTPKNQTKGGKMAAPPPSLGKNAKAGRADHHPRILRWPRVRPRMKKRTGMRSRRRAKKKEKKQRKARTVSRKTSSDFGKAGPQLTPYVQRSFAGNMRLSGIRVLSTWVRSWTEGLTLSNTSRSRLPKPSNLEPL